MNLDPAAYKEVAKAKFELLRGDLEELKRQKLEAIRGEYEARNAEFLAGRGTLDILFEASRHLLDAECDVNSTEADRIAATDRFWNRAELIEMLNRQRNDAGRISTKEYWESEFERMDAELHLARVRVTTGQAILSSGAISLPRSSLDVKQFAKAKFAASQSNAKKLAGAKVGLAQDAYAARYRNFVAGRGTLDIMLESSRRWRDAELARSENEADRVAALEREWESAWLTEFVNRAWFDAGRISNQDYLQSKGARLDAEIQLIRARAKQANPLAWQGGSRTTSDLLDFDRFSFKKLAKAKFEVGQSEVRSLLLAKFEAARGQYEDRLKEFLAGRGTLDILLEASQGLLQSERGISRDETDQLAALKRYRDRALLIEETNRRRYEADRVPIQDYLQARYFRFEADIWLLQAAARKEGRGTK